MKIKRVLKIIGAAPTSLGVDCHPLTVEDNLGRTLGPTKVPDQISLTIVWESSGVSVNHASRLPECNLETMRKGTFSGNKTYVCDESGWEWLQIQPPLFCPEFCGLSREEHCDVTTAFGWKNKKKMFILLDIPVKFWHNHSLNSRNVSWGHSDLCQPIFQPGVTTWKRCRKQKKSQKFLTF